MSKLPTDAQIGILLRDLVGRQVDCKEKKSKMSSNVLYAHYATQDGSEEAYSLWEFGPGVSIGAALTMLSPEEANTAIRKAVADDMILENFQEVCNILVRVLNEKSEAALFLKEIGATDVKKGPVADKLKLLKSVAIYELKVQGYGGGFMMIARP